MGRLTLVRTGRSCAWTSSSCPSPNWAKGRVKATLQRLVCPLGLGHWFMIGLGLWRMASQYLKSPNKSSSYANEKSWEQKKEKEKEPLQCSRWISPSSEGKSSNILPPKKIQSKFLQSWPTFLLRKHPHQKRACTSTNQHQRFTKMQSTNVVWYKRKPPTVALPPLRACPSPVLWPIAPPDRQSWGSVVWAQTAEPAAHSGPWPRSAGLDRNGCKKRWSFCTPSSGSWHSTSKDPNNVESYLVTGCSHWGVLSWEMKRLFTRPKVTSSRGGYVQNRTPKYVLKKTTCSITSGHFCQLLVTDP